jgi:2-polyprenyl-3-methyl-5-hydroxy-6-metoxy-1,4-benzoquinol methylase
MAFIRQKIREIGKNARILDAGCGEGVLVEDFQIHGYQIEGIDLNYESQYVLRGSVLDMPYEKDTFDMILLLDVFEHLAYADQPAALAEIRRVLRGDGHFIASIPNLAHWNSRFRMALFGQLDRTDIETNHIGERPFLENRILLQKAGFKIDKIKGITLTVPFLYRRIICRRPAWFRWLHDMLEPLAVPSLAMLNIFVCRKV